MSDQVQSGFACKFWRMLRHAAVPAAVLACAVVLFGRLEVQAGENPRKKAAGKSEKEPLQQPKNTGTAEEPRPAAGEPEVKKPAGTDATDTAQPETADGDGEKNDDAEAEDATVMPDAEDDEMRNPFEVGKKLLRDIKASQVEAKPPVAAPKPEPELPQIRVTGVMIVGDKRMATVDVEHVGAVTLLKGENVIWRLKNKQPFRFTVVDIEERQLTILTEDGTEVRALFK